MAKRIHTIKGPIEIDALGLILPHEHLFTDLRGPWVADYARAEASAVVKVVEPYLAEASAAGTTALVECSTVGVGRNLSVLRSLADITSIHIIAPTGVYRDAYIPESLREISEHDLAELWTTELTEGIEGTSIRAGFIKLAMSDDGPTALEIRNLKAAVKASQTTGAVIASHTIGGKVAKKEMDVLEEAGLDLHALSGSTPRRNQTFRYWKKPHAVGHTWNLTQLARLTSHRQNCSRLLLRLSRPVSQITFYSHTMQVGTIPPAWMDCRRKVFEATRLWQGISSPDY